MSASDDGPHDAYAEAVNAHRLKARISSVLRRAPKPVVVDRADGSTLLRGRRRGDRVATDTSDRRIRERRTNV